MLVLFLFLTGNFVQVGYIERGGGDPRILACDADRDSLVELIFLRHETPSPPPPAYQYLWFYEQTEYNSFNFLPKDSLVMQTNIGGIGHIWEIGDFDLDGKYDLLGYGGKKVGNTWICGPIILESIDSFSYPKQIVWEDTSQFPPFQSVFDADKDGIPEIFHTCWAKKINGQWVAADFAVYECIEDNKYKLIFLGNAPSANGAGDSRPAFGDFDGDGLIEFVIGDLNGKYEIWECTGDNTYEKRKVGEVDFDNLMDCISVNDADQDGKMEFVLKGEEPELNQFKAFIFEATGDNQYEVVKTFCFPGYGIGFSASGDVDGDGIPEIVLFTRYVAYVIKANGDNNFYVSDVIGDIPPDGISGLTLIYDIDKDGLNEIILSSYYCTKIFKYQYGIKEKIDYGIPVSKLKTIIKDKMVLKIEEPSFISIYNESGRKIKEIFANDKILEIKNLKGGIYWIKLKNEKFKIIKIR
jgi:hypothetical protein